MINKLLDSKANRSEVINWLDLKTNIKDTNSNMKATDVLHKQLMHLSVLVVEILRSEADKYMKQSQSVHSQKNKSMMMLHLGLSVNKWINKFNPENINACSLVLPKELWTFTEKIIQPLKDSNSQVRLDLE